MNARRERSNLLFRREVTMNNSTVCDGNGCWLEWVARAIAVGILLAVPVLGFAQFAPGLFSPLADTSQSGWLNDQGEIIWENPVIVYSFIRPELFLSSLPQLREFLHRMGRETNQGEIAFEFDGRFYRIRSFDADQAKGQP